MQRDHRITIKEIARMCGVSTQTVSRVINQRPDVAPRTRAAVEAAIAAVGFQPSAVARSLVQRRSQTLGVVIAGLKYFGVAQTLNGITEESETSGFALLLKEITSDDGLAAVRVIEFLLAHRVEGIIFVAPEMGTSIATVRPQLPAGHPPIVFLKSEPSPAFTTIMVDDYGGARQATGHLIALGRRHIAHVTGPLAWREARVRRDGWQDALREASLGSGPAVSGNWSARSGELAFDQLLRSAPDLDAVFAGNDQMALGILHAAHRRGVRIPDDVAIVGFDGLEEGAQFTPSLTTVRQPLAELGQLAVRELLALLEGEGTGTIKSLKLATQLVIRDSAPAVVDRAMRPGARAELARAGLPADLR